MSSSFGQDDEKDAEKTCAKPSGCFCAVFACIDFAVWIWYNVEKEDFIYVWCSLR